jgi:hypothetical protein
MTIRKNKVYTITFAAIDVSNRPARVSSIASFDSVKISQDGAAFQDTSNSPSEIGSSGRYSLALTAAEMDADNIHIYVEDSLMDPTDYILQTSGEETGVVVTDGSNTALTFETDLDESDNDYWRDALILFTSGSLVDQVKKITAYDGTTKFVTVGSAFTTTPTGGDRFVLVNL